MTTAAVGSELQNVILWFLDLPSVGDAEKVELIEYIQSQEAITAEAMIYIAQVLQQNGNIEMAQMKQLEEAQALIEELSSLEQNEDTSMQVAVIKEAEALMQKVVGDFKHDWNSYSTRKANEAEADQGASEKELVDSLKGKLTK